MVTRPAPETTPIAADELAARVDKVPADAGARLIVLAAAASPRALAVDDARTYWIDETRSLFEVSNEGGPPTSRARTRHNPMRGQPRLAVDGGVLCEKEVVAGSAAQATTGSEWTDRLLCELR